MFKIDSLYPYTEMQVKVGALAGEIIKCQNPLGLPMGEQADSH